MKLTTSFAVLAVLVAQTFVTAAPTPASYDSDILDARADIIDGALEEVLTRFYDEIEERSFFDEDLLERGYFDEEDLLERGYFDEEDLLERGYFDEEDLFERAPMKKFATDIATNLAQKAPQYAQQYSKSKEAEQRNKQPKMASIAQQAMAKNNIGSKPATPKPISAVKPLPADSKWNALKKPGVLDQVKKLNQKKRSLDALEDFLYERAPMKKFATDLATNLAQKAPKYAQQYTKSKEAEQRNQQPKVASIAQQAMAKNNIGSKPATPKPLNAAKPLPVDSKWNTLKKPGVLDQVKKLNQKKKRSLDAFEDFLYERAPMKKFATDIATNLAQKAPQFAQQYTQSQEAQRRNQAPRMASVVQQAMAKNNIGSKPTIPKPLNAIKPLPVDSKWNTLKKPGVLDQVRKLNAQKK